MESLLCFVGRMFYFVTGWEFEPAPPYLNKKHVIIGFPHVSNMDTVRAFTGFRIARIKGHVIMKKEWFFFPMSLFLKKLGGIPVNRGAKDGVVDLMAEEFNKRNSFYLSIVPEGTRKKTDSIKTGFWHIAKKAEVPIILWYLDNESKVTRWLGKVDPTDFENDMIQIKRIYSEAGYEIPWSPK